MNTLRSLSHLSHRYGCAPNALLNPRRAASFARTAFARRKRSRRALLLFIGVPLVLVLVGGGVAVALIVHHNNEVAAQKRAATQRRTAQQAAQRVAQQRSLLAQKQQQRAQAALRRIIASSKRDSIVSALQSSVKTDAEKDVADGILTGPILKVQCQPASSADATASIATYTWVAANSIANGTLSGYRFSATININSGAYTWHLGG
jgi:hypothetical protein